MDSVEKKNRSKPGRSKCIIAEQEHYAAVSDFCRQYGLRYTTVQYYLRKGLNGDQVLAILRQKPASSRYTKAPGKAVPVKIGNDTFQSISEAAMAYGVSPFKIEEAMLNGDATADSLNIESLDESDSISERMQPCDIAGVHYQSKAAAARAYGIPMVTINSRMAREGISFEEALRRGHIERRHIVSKESQWQGRSFEPYEGDMEEMKLSKEILSILEENCYCPQLLQDRESGIFAARILESLEVISPPLELYVLYKEDRVSQEIEFIIPSVGKLRILSDEKQMQLCQQINEVNRKYMGSKIFLQDRNFSASWSFPQASRTVQATFFMRTLYRFIGSTSKMWETLKWADKGLSPD